MVPACLVRNMSGVIRIRPGEIQCPIHTLGIEVNVPLRAQEIAPLELPEQWQDNNGERIRLTFGTGSDSSLDRVRGKSNLSIFVSGDRSTFDVVDTNRPFLRNDSEFWDPENTYGRAVIASQTGYYWSKPFRTMAQAVYSHVLVGPVYVLEAVKLTRDDLVKATDAYLASDLVGRDWMGDLYIVKRGPCHGSQCRRPDQVIWMDQGVH